MSRSNRNSRIEQEIDDNLKRAFEEVANQDLPSRFTDLLSQLRQQDAGQSAKDDTHEQ